jgi:HEAT repeat protein
MQNEHRFALMFSRLVDLMRQNSGSSNERRAALQGLVDAANMRSNTIRLEDGVLTVEGIKAPQDVPFVRSFIGQLRAHDIAEIRVGLRPAPIDLIQMVVALAGEPGPEPIRSQLERAKVLTVAVLTGDEAQTIRDRRKQPVPEDLMGGPSSVGQSPGGVQQDFVSARAGAAYDQMVEITEASSTTLAAAVRRLRRVHDDAPELSKGLNAVAAGVVTSVRENRMPEAVDAIIAVIRQEGEEHREDVQLRYGVALRRILQPEVLQPLLEYLLDPLYNKDVAEIMRRAGQRGTELLLEVLIAATTFAERRAYLEALRQIDTGMDVIVATLNHHQWYVVRNVADLVGELRIEEGVPGLGDAAKHEDSRVRLSAGLALAKIGTPSAVKHLGALLRDKDMRVRLEVAKAVEGRGLAALAMPLVNAADSEEDSEIRQEFYRALGRIGTNDAVQALIKAAKPKGILSGLRNVPGVKQDGNRLAATEALGLAGGKLAIPALEDLAQDRDRSVREMAKRGLERTLQSSRGAGETSQAP